MCGRYLGNISTSTCTHICYLYGCVVREVSRECWHIHMHMGSRDLGLVTVFFFFPSQTLLASRATPPFFPARFASNVCSRSARTASKFSAHDAHTPPPYYRPAGLYPSNKFPWQGFISFSMIFLFCDRLIDLFNGKYWFCTTFFPLKTFY